MINLNNTFDNLINYFLPIAIINLETLKIIKINNNLKKYGNIESLNLISSLSKKKNEKKYGSLKILTDRNIIKLPCYIKILHIDDISLNGIIEINISKYWSKFDNMKIRNKIDDVKNKIQNKNFLIVDDSKTNIFILVNVLKYYTIPDENIEIAEDGLIALEKSKERFYDVILMDCVMPNMNGFEATQKILEIHESKKEPLIIGVTSENDDIENKCYYSGMKAYVSKPYKYDVFIDIFDKFLDS
jgi:CheY-like chemotaxis protein